MEDNNLINLFVLMIINLLSYLALLSCAMSLVEYILCCWEDKLKEENAQQNILVIISDCNIPIRIITISTISVIICLIYLACGLHYEILPNGKNILFFIAIFGLAIHLWIMRSKVTRIQKPNKIIEQERLDENELFRTIILKNIIAWPAIHVLAIFVGVVVGLLSYIYFQCIIMGFIIGIVTMIFLLLFLSFVLYICKIPIDTFTNSACFKDDECVFYLLYIPCITIMWDCIYLYKSEYTEYTFLIIFPFIVMILLLLVFMYRIGAGKTHVATEYQGNKKRKVWTIAFLS